MEENIYPTKNEDVLESPSISSLGYTKRHPIYKALKFKNIHTIEKLSKIISQPNFSKVISLSIPRIVDLKKRFAEIYGFPLEGSVYNYFTDERLLASFEVANIATIDQVLQYFNYKYDRWDFRRIKNVGKETETEIIDTLANNGFLDENRKPKPLSQELFPYNPEKPTLLGVHSEITRTHISTLNLDKRVFNILVKNNICCLGDLFEYYDGSSWNKLREIPKLGSTYQQEILGKLREKGYIDGQDKPVVNINDGETVGEHFARMNHVLELIGKAEQLKSKYQEELNARGGGAK